MHWLLRMKRWAQNPPSMSTVRFVLAVIAAVVALAIYEHYFGWPEALTPERNPRHMLHP